MVTSHSASTPEIEQVQDDFALFDDWEDKYAYLIDLGKQLTPLNEEDKTEANRVHGCTSQVWMTHETASGEQGVLRHYFYADSDAYLVRGLIAILLRIYSGQDAATIQRIDMQALFDELGLGQALSPNRSNGFFAMTRRIQELSGEAV
jgi:cysteine desulfuration protein SufE